METFFDSLVGLGNTYLTGMSATDVAKANANSAAQAAAAQARAGTTNWLLIGTIGGVLIVVVVAVFAFMRRGR